MDRKLKGMGVILAVLFLFAAALVIGWSAGYGLRSGLSLLILSLGTLLSVISIAALAGKRWTRPENPRFRQISTRGRGDRTLQDMLVAQTGPQEDRPGEAALINHEIRNHLCTLKGNALLLRQRIAGKGHEAIIDRIDHVVERLESFAADAEKRVSDPPSKIEPFRMEDVARTVARTHFFQAATQFRWDIRKGPEAVQGEPARVEHVFLNLYVNAIEAGALNVTTSVRVFRDRVVVRVEDDGCGCHVADLDRIFEPFFSTKQGPARRGLGMVIVRSIVESLGGSIKVRSKNGLGRGSHGLIFQLEFPMMTGGAPSGRAPAEMMSRSQASLTAVHSRNWLLTLPEPI